MKVTFVVQPKHLIHHNTTFLPSRVPLPLPHPASAHGMVQVRSEVSALAGSVPLMSSPSMPACFRRSSPHGPLTSQQQMAWASSAARVHAQAFVLISGRVGECSEDGMRREARENGKRSVTRQK